MLRAAPLALLLCCGGAVAQALPAPSAPAADRPESRIERIVVEDSANRIDELRVGGQTRSISVQPRNGAPAYVVDPGALNRSRTGEDRSGASGDGRRSWPVLSF